MKLSEAQMSLLRQTSIFYAVPEVTIEKIVASADCCVKRYEKGRLVYGKTDFSRSLGIVLSGNLRVTKGNAGGNGIRNGYRDLERCGDNLFCSAPCAAHDAF